MIDLRAERERASRDFEVLRVQLSTESEARVKAETQLAETIQRLAEEKKFRFDGGDTTHFRIPLGVGYFGPLRSWVAGGQALATATEDAPDFVRARRLVALCLGPARRNPQVRAIQKGLMDVREGE